MPHLSKGLDTLYKNRWYKVLSRKEAIDKKDKKSIYDLSQIDNTYEVLRFCILLLGF